MANMLMSWGSFLPEAGTAYVTGGAKKPEGVSGGRFPILSFNWRASRKVKMDIGNVRNRSSGMMSMDVATFSRKLDRASEYLLSRMYVPGGTGDTGDMVNIIVNKSSREGQGLLVSLQIQLQDVIIVKYGVDIIDGETPIENLAVVYNEIAFSYWSEKPGGGLERLGIVAYDLAGAEVLCHSLT